MELGAVLVLDGEDLAALAVRLDFRGSDELADAVVDVDDVLAGLELVEVVEPRTLGDGRVGPHVRLLLGEDAVRLGDDEKPRELESAGEVVDPDDEIAALFRGGDVPVEALAGGVEEFRMVRLVRPKFPEAR